MMLTRTAPTMTIILLFLSGFIKFEIILGGGIIARRFAELPDSLPDRREDDWVDIMKKLPKFRI